MKRIFFILVAFLSITNIMAQSSTKQTPPERIIIYEDGNRITYLQKIARNNRKSDQRPPTTKDDYFLELAVETLIKNQAAHIESEYTLHLIPNGKICKTKIRLERESYCVRDGPNGQTEPTGKWEEGGELGAQVVNYYLTHKTDVPIYCDKLDTTRWKPLQCLDDEGDGEQQLLSLTIDKAPSGTNDAEITLTLEVLVAPKIVTHKGELVEYVKSKISLRFFPKEGRNFVQRRLITEKTYSNGKETDTSDPGTWEDLCYAAESEFCMRLLEYYKIHKTDIRETKDSP